jgi:septal ring factor EnvC (AmiA/AmiB activator)
MGFNRRKMEDQRRHAAEKDAAARRATDAQVLEDAERLIAARNERQAIGAPVIFSRRDGGLLVPVGALSGLPNDQCNRSTGTRSSP